ncbi:MAG TPA: methyltransferase domain-containing protein [Dehalococcoidia bacterium]|nr:methyltransferase domain-containing protein [Dehalococcoidia bacterium]
MLSHSHAAAPQRMGTYYRAELLKVLGLTKVQGRVLDIGGYDGFLLSQIEATEKVSVDLDTKPAYGGIKYCRGDGLSLPFADGSFDAIFALDVLEHVDDEERFVGELMRVLGPNGRIVLSTPQNDIRIFPAALQAWTNKRWQHYRTPGYTQEAVDSLFRPLHPVECRVRKLSASWFLRLYLPLSVVWRIAPKLGLRLLSKIASLDRRLTGPHGYLLAEVRK